ncbi:MAG: hypothetical protein ACR2PR_09420 [Pseudohongiellaceae bacterium]
MSETRKYLRSNNRQLINYDFVVGKSGENRMVCIDVGFLEICKALAVTRGRWKSTYVKSLGETFYTTPTDSEMTAIENIIAEGLIQMTDCNDIEQAIDQLTAAVTALSGGGCECGSGGAGGTSPPLDPTTTDDPTQPGGTPPAGYSTWAEYQGRKCDIATWIVDSLEDDLIWLEGGALGALAVGAASVGLVSFLSGGTLTAIVALSVGVIGLGASAISELKDAVTANKEGLVCSLYEADNATSSQADFQAALATAIDGETADTVARYVLKEFANLWADPSQINLMYEPLTETSKPIPAGGDCSACLGCPEYNVLRGTNTGGFNWSSEEEPANNLDYVDFFVNSTAQDYVSGCGPEQAVTISNLVGWVDPGPGSNFAVFDATGTLVYGSQDTPWPAQTCGRYFQVRSDTPFTVTLTKEDCP